MIGILVLSAAVAAVAAAAPGRPQPAGEAAYTTKHELCPEYEHFLLPHEYDCTKFYYCEYGMKRETPSRCAPGTEFAFELQVCVQPHLANCTLPGTSTPSDTTDDTTTDVTTSTAAPTTTTTIATESTTTTLTPTTTISTSPTTTTSESEGEFLDNGCPADFYEHKLLPHETECNKFYYCVWGEKVERECAPGTYFNPDIQVCDWPYNVNCTDENINPGTTTSAPTTPSTPSPETTTDSTTTTASTESTITTVPPTTVSTTTTVAPTTESTTESTTTAGTTAEFTGTTTENMTESTTTTEGSTTEFTETTTELITDSTTTAESTTARSTTESIVTTTEPTTDSTTKAESTTEITTTTISEENLLENGCPADFDVHKLLPHETDCSKFYYCVYGEKIEHDCPSGTYFNPDLEVCDWPHNVNCTSPEGGGEPELPDDDDNRCEDECHVLPWPHEKDCDKFWRCEGSKPVLVVCSEGLHFNPETGTCDFMCNVGCVRDRIQKTPLDDGLKIFVPWSKIKPNMWKWPSERQP